jgi:hypothetical protein
MRNPLICIVVSFLFTLSTTACSTQGSTAMGTGDVTKAPAALATNTQAPTATETLEPSPTLTMEPSPTPTPAILQLEIVEWAEFPYANLANPQNTDTRVEILVHNPNEFPVRVNTDEVKLRLLNIAGEIVYTNPNPTFYIWEGSWMMGGETAPISVCVCFETDGVAKQEWKSLELIAPLEAEKEIAFTTEVSVSIGEFFSLEKAHLGGDGLGTEIKLVNTSGQALESFEARVIARDASKKYVGVAVYGSFVDRDNSGAYLTIEPGASGGGIVVSEIDYVDEPLSYEVTAIGIPVKK